MLSYSHKTVAMLVVLFAGKTVSNSSSSHEISLDNTIPAQITVVEIQSLYILYNYSEKNFIYRIYKASPARLIPPP